MIKNYKLFTESIRDKMTPKSEDDVKSILSDNNVVDKVNNIFNYNLQHYYSEEELKNIIKKALEYMSFAEQTEFAINRNVSWIIEDLYKEGYFDYQSILDSALSFAWISSNTKILNMLRKYKKNKKINESVRDKMTPKSEEELDQIMNRMTPREMFLKSFSITIDNIHPTKRPLYPRAMKFMKPFKDVRIGDLLTVSPYPGNRDLPLYPIKEKITFKNKEEYLEYKKNNPKVVIADQALDMLFNFHKEPSSQNAVVVFMGADLIFPYGQMWTGVFPYTKEELDTLRSTPLPPRQNNNPNPLNVFNDTFESVRDKMTGKSTEDIKKELGKIPKKKDWITLSDMNMNLNDVYTEEEILEMDPEALLEYSFYNNYIKGIKYVLDNYKLYGENSKFTISCFMPDIKNDKDLADLLKDKQVIKFLTSDQKYVLEKYRLGMHQNEVKGYEERLLDILKTLKYYESEDNPEIMVGKKKNKNYFNYNKTKHELIWHLDNMSSFITGIDDEDDYESHRGDRMYGNEFKFGARYFNLIMKGVIGNYYKIKIDKSDGSRNDEYSFMKK